VKPQLIAQRLHDLGIAQIGTNLFLFDMPADCIAGILVKMPLTGVAIDHELPGYYHDDIQVIVRAAKFATGQAMADQVMAALTLYEHEFRDGGGVLLMKVNHMLPRTLPIVYRRSEGNQREWSMNFMCSCVIP